ncbi:MAG: DUF192 domain-containing protein [Elusimicrobia bacterium]|nr:DUF192 domain-containing protein [Elusimicrobiota bacterium]
MVIKNRTRRIEIAGRLRLARGFWERIQGLLGQRPLDNGEAMVLYSVCPQVHTFFMRYPIDCLFINRHNEVVGAETLAPWRLSRIYWKADRVIELPRGTIAASGTGIGDQIDFDG